MYSSVPNKRVYSIIIFRFFRQPTRLLGTIFWNSTNSKPTCLRLGPTCLIKLYKIPTLLVWLAPESICFHAVGSNPIETTYTYTIWTSLDRQTERWHYFFSYYFHSATRLHSLLRSSFSILRRAGTYRDVGGDWSPPMSDRFFNPIT